MVTDAGACATWPTVIEIYLSSETSPSVYGAELAIDELRLAVSDIPRAYPLRFKPTANRDAIRIQFLLFSFSLQRAQLNTAEREWMKFYYHSSLLYRYVTAKSNIYSSLVLDRNIVNRVRLFPRWQSCWCIVATVGYSKTFDSRMFTPLWPSQRGWSLRVTGGWFSFRRLRRVLDDDSSR